MSMTPHPMVSDVKARFLVFSCTGRLAEDRRNYLMRIAIWTNRWFIRSAA